MTELKTYSCKIAGNENISIDCNDCPLPVDVIPNYMGINLCAVKNIIWTRQEDGQLENLVINFIPE